MIVLTLVASVLDAVKLQRGVQDKQLSYELGFESQADYSKSKHGVRPMDFERVLTAPDETFWAIHAAMADVRGKRMPSPDRDLVADLVGRVDALLRAMNGWRPEALKAEFPAAVAEKRSA